jgi:phosphotransferase system enzyme I (PtsI)
MNGRPRVFRGIGASPGVAIGRVFLLNRGQVRVPRFHVEHEQVAAECERLDRAIDASIAQLTAIRPRLVGAGGEQVGILDAHEMMLRDKSMLEEVVQKIQGERINAEWAVSDVIGRIRSLFDQLTDSYLRERKDDIDFTGDRILRNLVGEHADLSDIGAPGEAAVVVARELNPVDTALITRHKVHAFVTEMGGKTSHTSIVARSLDVPAVVGAHGVLETAGSGDTIVVDGLEGTVMLRPSRAQLERGRRRARRFHQLNLSLLEAKALPARTPDGHTLSVQGNIEVAGEVAGVLDRGGEGIGLYRTEYMFLGRDDLPSEDEHAEAYRRIFALLGDRPVTVRTFDLGGDKVFGPAHHDEANPALGLRAIRLCLAERPMFEVQVAGLLRAAAHGNVRVMLPMISGLEELLEAKRVIREVAERLAKDGVEHRSDVPIGIMVEVPSAALCASQLASHADFFSIGTNDLLQYLLAIDRTNERVAYLYRPLHPAVLRCLKMTVDAAKAANIAVSVCGEMAGDIEFTAVLLGLGVDTLSMNAGSIPRIKRLVREMSRKDCERLVADVLAEPVMSQSEAAVRRFVDRHTAFLGPGFR